MTLRGRRLTSWMLTASFLVLLIFSRDAFAQSRGFSGTGKMVVVQSQTMMFPGDNPAHQMMFVSRTDAFSSADPDWNDVQAKFSGFADFTAGSGPHSGYLANTHRGGD